LIIAEKKIYFASDLHLGSPNHAESLKREKKFVAWLDFISDRASDIYLLGDIFDFWFEYGKVIPKGFIRLQGKLAELSDRGIQIHLFSGNHDLWYRDYFPREIGAKLYFEPVIHTFFGKTYYLAHGDGLGPGDHGYKFLKTIFTNRVCKWLFGRLHPNFGIWLASYLSGKSRKHKGGRQRKFFGEKEFLVVHAREMLKLRPEISYFVFGHRHVPVTFEVNPGVYGFFLGDWIHHFTYLEVSKDSVGLKTFPDEQDISNIAIRVLA
jgi:UDP-2,3-diacylglucosamine hydrolase